MADHRRAELAKFQHWGVQSRGCFGAEGILEGWHGGEKYYILLGISFPVWSWGWAEWIQDCQRISFSWRMLEEQRVLVSSRVCLGLLLFSFGSLLNCHFSWPFLSEWQSGHPPPHSHLYPPILQLGLFFCTYCHLTFHVFCFIFFCSVCLLLPECKLHEDREFCLLYSLLYP